MIRTITIVVFAMLSLALFYFLLKPAEPDQSQNKSQTLPTRTPEASRGQGQSNSHALIAFVGMPTGLDVQVLNKDCFIIGYYEKAEQAAWVMYETDGKRSKLKLERDNQFYEDDEVRTGSATTADYRKSGYDRGHLVPAGDMKTDAACFHNSFLLSNISPQNHAFNTGLWKRIEEKTRKWAMKSPVLVMTGGVLKGKAKTIGRNKVAVPEAYYKIIYTQLPQPSCIAFLCPNKDSKLSIEKFAVSVDKVEEETGLDFLSKLPDAAEADLESPISLRQWF